MSQGGNLLIKGSFPIGMKMPNLGYLFTGEYIQSLLLNQNGFGGTGKVRKVSFDARLDYFLFYIKILKWTYFL